MQKQSKLFRNKKTISPQKKSYWKLFILFLILAGLLFWGISEYKFSTDIEQKISLNTQFEIQKGESVKSFSARLEEENFITSASSLEKFLKREEMGKKIKFGNHALSGNLSIADIAQILTEKTQAKSLKITIPEGFTLIEINELLTEKFAHPSTSLRDRWTAGENFLNCIEISCDFSGYNFLPKDRKTWEGYFFPATYLLTLDKISAENLAKKMLDAFAGRIKKHNLSEYKNYSLQDVLTMASIIEKESSGKNFNTNEAKMISGILWNRIEAGIPLGADATIRYGLSKDSSALTQSELFSNNDFNTRKNKGFPPYAISAPGDISMDAAVNPVDTDYLFYLHDKSQKIHYAKTNAGHEANKRKFCGGSCE